jgi:hypothetical protein
VPLIASPIQGCVKVLVIMAWVVRRHSEAGVFASRLVDMAGGWGGCD